VADTVNWLKGSHSIGLGGNSASATCGSPLESHAMPSIGFGTQTGDPALGMFTAANFLGSSGDRNSAAALYAVLTGRVTSIGERSTGCRTGQ
jgi:hypothetical protein